jgi:hypothetical protein
MTDLRAALTEACDLAQHLALIAAHPGPPSALTTQAIDRLRSLATSPLTVLDALRDPEVRAGRRLVEYELAFDSTQPARVRRLRVMPGTFLGLIQSQSRAGDEWYDLTLGVADLDAPCRLVPAEGGGE